MKTEEELKAEIAAIEKDAKAARASLDQCHADLLAKQLEPVEVKYGIKIGSIVNNGEQDFKITTIKPYSDWKPNIWGAARKQNGEFGSMVRYVYGNWTVVQK